MLERSRHRVGHFDDRQCGFFRWQSGGMRGSADEDLGSNRPTLASRMRQLREVAGCRKDSEILDPISLQEPRTQALDYYNTL